MRRDAVDDAAGVVALGHGLAARASRPSRPTRRCSARRHPRGRGAPVGDGSIRSRPRGARRSATCGRSGSRCRPRRSRERRPRPRAGRASSRRPLFGSSLQQESRRATGPRVHGHGPHGAAVRRDATSARRRRSLDLVSLLRPRIDLQQLPSVVGSRSRSRRRRRRRAAGPRCGSRPRPSAPRADAAATPRAGPRRARAPRRAPPRAEHDDGRPRPRPQRARHPGAAAGGLLARRRLDEVLPEAGDVVAHRPSPLRSVARPRDMRLRTTASEVWSSSASSP